MAVFDAPSFDFIMYYGFRLDFSVVDSTWTRVLEFCAEGLLNLLRAAFLENCDFYRKVTSWPSTLCVGDLVTPLRAYISRLSPRKLLF